MGIFIICCIIIIIIFCYFFYVGDLGDFLNEPIDVKIGLCGATLLFSFTVSLFAHIFIGLIIKNIYLTNFNNNKIVYTKEVINNIEEYHVNSEKFDYTFLTTEGNVFNINTGKGKIIVERDDTSTAYIEKFEYKYKPNAFEKFMIFKAEDIIKIDIEDSYIIHIPKEE